MINVPIDLSDSKRVYIKTEQHIKYACPKCSNVVEFKAPDMLYYGSAGITADCSHCGTHLEFELNVKVQATLSVIEDVQSESENK